MIAYGRGLGFGVSEGKGTSDWFNSSRIGLGGIGIGGGNGFGMGVGRGDAPGYNRGRGGFKIPSIK